MDDALDRRCVFGVLGPLTVLRDGDSVPVGGPKERVVLAHLLACANHVVPVDALVEAVWADRPPRSAERTLQAYVARLRGALEPDRATGVESTMLRKAGSGYRLNVESWQVDALRFEELAHRGSRQLEDRDAAALGTLREALRLWRGDAMDGFRTIEACETEARRLEEMRLVALEDRLDADLAAGGSSELVAELESLVARHEFRERLWAQLMLALYRSGRQRDALDAYRRARAVLIEQLGIEPGRDLRALEAAILSQDPALDLPAAVAPSFGLPPPLESVGPAFVGRDVELAWLRTAWLDAADGRGSFVSVLGPEGIGKTRLVAELAREVQRSGGVVLYARCGALGSGIRALLDQALGSDDRSLDELDGSAVMQMLATHSRGRPMLLAVDDVHLADADTIELLAELAGWSAAGPLLVVATFRTDADGPEPPMPRHGDVGTHLLLRGLDHVALQRVCEMYAPDGWWPDDIDRLREMSEGVPLRVHELVSEWARDRAIRDVGAAADRSATAQSRLAGLRAEIAQSVEGIQQVLDHRRANMAARQAERAGTDPDVSGRRPYKGLAAFEQHDAADFFGRERLVAELVARLAGSRLLAVVGPSGSGKSSLVRAGLLPALAAGILPVAGGWRPVIETPGSRLGGRGVGAWPSGRTLVFVDQFEEIFGLDRQEQAELIDRLVEAARRPDHVVVIAVRADHLDGCAAFPALAELISGNDVLVGPMSEVELRRAIERPAQRAGGRFEPGLVELMIAEVAGRPGALPLLSTALAETWERRTDGVLTLRAYAAAGGVNGALASLAEDTFAALGPEQQLAVRRLMIRLCDTVEAGSHDMRRRLPLDELELDDDARVGLAAFVDRRLLVVDRDTVEVAHEALLREWPRLRRWLDDDVQGRRLHGRLSDAARAWRASDEDPFELYRGTRLDSALDWASAHPDELTVAEQSFLDASAGEAARELDDAHRRAAEKARNNRRLRWLLAGVAALLVVAVVAGSLFVRQRERAEVAFRDATARELASEATGAIAEDPELAMLLALEAVDTSERAGADPLPEAVSSLQQATQASRLLYRREEAGRFVDVSNDGTRIATASAADPGAVLVWDAVTGDVLRTLPGPDPLAVLSEVRFSPDGRLIAGVYSNETDGSAVAVVLWDAVTGDVVARLHGKDDAYYVPTFSPDGQSLVTVSTGGGDAFDLVTVWDVRSANERFAFQLEGVGGQPEFLPDGTAFLMPDGANVSSYSTDDGRRLDRFATPGYEANQLALDAAGGLLALGSQTDREVQIRDIDTGELVRRIAMADVGPLDWSTEGGRLAVAGANQSPIRLIDVASGQDPLVLSGHESGSWDVAFIGGGDRLASVGQNGGLRVWDVSPDGPPGLGAVTPHSGSPFDLQISPDGAELLVTTLGRTIERLAADSSELLAERPGQLAGSWPYAAPVSADWRLAASANQSDGSAAVLDPATLSPYAASPALPVCTTPVAFSDDGAVLALDARSMCAVGKFIGPFAPPPDADLRSRVIETDSGREVLDLDLGDEGVGTMVFNPEGEFAGGRYLAVNVEFERLHLYDLVERRLIGTLPVPDLLLDLEFDASGRRLLGSTGGGRVWVLDVAAVVGGASPEQAIILDQIADDGSLNHIAVSADGNLATAGLGDRVKLWDLSSGALLIELRTSPTQGGTSVAFGPDGSYLMYTDGVVIRRYDLGTDELVRRARSVLTRDLTADECRQYLGVECPD